MEILLIADDLTGTLDGAAALVGAGVDVCTRIDFQNGAGLPTTNAAVLAVNADTRHVAPAVAWERVARIVAAGRAAGARVIMKKTDSALRGNIGSELAGVLDAVPGAGPIRFMPAFPAMKRVTKGGIQYIEGVPVNESVFGRDPFEPVTRSSVREIIASQVPELSVGCRSMDKVLEEDAGSADVIVYDAESDEEMSRCCREALDGSSPVLLAGCAGFAQALASVLDERGHLSATRYPGRGPGNLLVFCGSVNEVSTSQCTYARKAGNPSFSLPDESKFYPEWVESDAFKAFESQVAESWRTNALTVIESGARFDPNVLPGVHYTGTTEDLRCLVSRNLGRILKHLVHGSCLVFVMGGDVFLSFLEEMGVTSISLVAEVATGVVMSEFMYEGSPVRVISKSGGFGEPDLFVSLACRLAQGSAPVRSTASSSVPSSPVTSQNPKKEEVLVACSSPIA
ncbi:four-carbon acid sugar kinase family protein [Enorma phocaeensis]|uniref:four-carbon acid sugar kinase family protein n=1 Tax=Enorma phocaeensis TaxID=1871019 RepID=UPI002352AF1B|nr:four-carbon acid sugar kinase family protein [Enorma phocaeensis]